MPVPQSARSRERIKQIHHCFKASAAAITYAADGGRRGIKFDVVTRWYQVQRSGEKDIKPFKPASDCSDVVSPLWRFAPFHDSPGKIVSAPAIVPGKGKPIPRCRIETIPRVLARVSVSRWPWKFDG